MQRIAFSRIIFLFCETKDNVIAKFRIFTILFTSKGLPRNLHLSKIKILYSIIAYDVQYYDITLLLFKKEVNIA